MQRWPASSEFSHQPIIIDGDVTRHPTNISALPSNLSYLSLRNCDIPRRYLLPLPYDITALILQLWSNCRHTFRARSARNLPNHYSHSCFRLHRYHSDPPQCSHGTPHRCRADTISPLELLFCVGDFLALRLPNSAPPLAMAAPCLRPNALPCSYPP